MFLAQTLTRPVLALIGLNSERQAICRSGQLFVESERVHDGTYRAKLPGNDHEYQLTVVGGVPILYSVNQGVASTYGTSLDNDQRIVIYM
ncbi:MAG: hypothetical protein J4428_00190 [Candidatus Aenigmarchaeota archaeon]|nr:hypothetical protein [Candidatus Aenigmarchaeota archaeon]